MDDSPLPLSVLIVNDYPDTAETCAGLLRLEGYAARAARSGSEALRLAAAEPPDVALLDLRMPDMDGCALATRLANLAGQAGHQPPLIVAVTGCATETDAARTAAAGFHLHLAKPVDPAALLGLLGRFQRATSDLPPADPRPPYGGRGASAAERCVMP